MVFVAFGGIVDLQMLGTSPNFFLLGGMRLLMAAACLLLAAALGRRPALALQPIPLNVVLMLLSTASIVVVPLRPGTADVQVTAAIAVIFTLYLFIPNRLLWAAVQGVYLSLGFLLTTVLWGNARPDRLGGFLLVIL